MQILKKINRKIISPILMNLKGDKIMRNFTNNSILNIMYHGVVLEDSAYFSPRHLTKEQFEKQLKYFAREFDVISIPKAFEYIKNGHKPKRKTITISFDDGYKNNLNVALPLLEKYNMKTTFFISGICTEEMKIRALWPDIIACLQLFVKNVIIELDDKKFKNFIEINSKISLSDFLKSCDAATRNRYLNYLINEYDIGNRLSSIPESFWKLLNKVELRELSLSEIVEIGSHGHTHYNLAEIEINEAKNELKNSKEVLEKAINKVVNSVAYPDGSYNDKIKDISEQLGYNYQMAVNYRSANDATDLRILNRHGISSTTTFEANMLLISNAFRSKGLKCYE